MTATSDFMNADALALEPVRVADGGRMIMRAGFRLVGVALLLASMGLWLAPGANWESDVMLLKLLLTSVAVIAGLGCMQASANPTAPEVEIDTIRREVRLLRKADDGSAAVLQHCSFADLTRAEVRGSHVRLFGADSNLLAELSLYDRKALRRLMAGLEDAGKLV